ncbi:MAG: YceI family protein [Acidimicrobiia bacterium]
MKKLLLWVGVGVLTLVVVALSGWYFFLKTDPEPRAAVIQTPLQTEAPTTANATDAGTTSDPASAIAGTYTVKPGSSQNFVGYRVTEKLVANVVESTATGRTDNVTGTLTIKGTRVSDVTVTADLRDLTSDQSFRDGRLHSSGIESDRFPQAKFVLTEPITLPKVPAAGETIKVDATGDFTLHGVTKQVTIPIEARWDGTDVQIVGNLPIVFGDYNITAPTAPPVASVDDHGEMEFQLFFKESGA